MDEVYLKELARNLALEAVETYGDQHDGHKPMDGTEIKYLTKEFMQWQAGYPQTVSARTDRISPQIVGVSNTHSHKTPFNESHNLYSSVARLSLIADHHKDDSHQGHGFQCQKMKRCALFHLLVGLGRNQY